MLYLSILI